MMGNRKLYKTIWYLSDEYRNYMVSMKRKEQLEGEIKLKKWDEKTIKRVKKIKMG